MLTETNKKLSAIFIHIKVPADAGLYKIYEFESPEDKPTIAVKLVFEDIENINYSTKYREVSERIYRFSGRLHQK